MKRLVIIGNGAAGASGAEAARKADPSAAISIFTDETHPHYYRPRLPEVVSGQVAPERIILRDAAWYRAQGIELHLGDPVEAVDLARGRVLSRRGRQAPFDALLLADGGHAFVPPLPGADKKNVFTLRTLDDAQRLREAAGRAKAAVLLGGGLLGLEAGVALARRGIKVAVVELASRLLPRQMDGGGARLLQQRLEALGMTFLLGEKAREITGQEEANGLLLESGTRLEGEILLFSAGVRGNLGLAKAMGLAINQGVSVDDRLATSAPGVFAAGDAVEHRGRLYGIWPASQEQGKVAGTNLAGGAATYQGTLPSNSLKVAGVDLTAAGEIDAEGRHQSAVYQDEAVYRKLVLDQGRLIGFIFFGTTRGVAEAQAALKAGADLGRHLEALGQRDFDFSRLD